VTGLRDAVLGTAGAILTALSTVVVFVPEFVRSIGPVDALAGLLSGVGATVLLTLGTAVAAIYLAAIARAPTGGPPDTRSVAERRFDRARVRPPEAVTADRRQVTAASVDADVDSAVETGGEELATLREALSRTAVEVYADRADVDTGPAREAVAAGTWTGDPTAAAFLAGDRGPGPDPRARLRLWLSPEHERRRRIDRTLAEIRRLAEGRR
jgi:hypothetical protein